MATEVHAMSVADQYFFNFRIIENGIGDRPLTSHVNVEMTLKLYNTAHCYDAIYFMIIIAKQSCCHCKRMWCVLIGLNCVFPYFSGSLNFIIL